MKGDEPSVPTTRAEFARGYLTEGKKEHDENEGGGEQAYQPVDGWFQWGQKWNMGKYEVADGPCQHGDGHCPVFEELYHFVFFSILFSVAKLQIKSV